MQSEFSTEALNIPDGRSIGKPGLSDGYIRPVCQADVTVNYVLAPDPSSSNRGQPTCERLQARLHNRIARLRGWPGFLSIEEVRVLRDREA